MDTIFGKFNNTKRKFKEKYKQTKVDIKLNRKKPSKHNFIEHTHNTFKDLKENEYKEDNTKKNIREKLENWKNEKKTRTGKTSEEWQEMAKEEMIRTNISKARLDGYILSGRKTTDEEYKQEMINMISHSKNRDHANSMAIAKSKKEEEDKENNQYNRVSLTDWKKRNLEKDGVGFL